jgi:Flp pilus assembly protein TadG
MLRSKHGYSMTFWAVFIGFIMVPLMALSIEVGRFYFARAQVAAAADAAALAAAVEINERTFVSTGQVVLPSSDTYSWAQRAVNANCAGLISLGVNPGVQQIKVSGRTVMVAVSADLDILFPSIIPDISVTEWGRAEVKAVKK